MGTFAHCCGINMGLTQTQGIPKRVHPHCLALDDAYRHQTNNFRIRALNVSIRAPMPLSTWNVYVVITSMLGIIGIFTPALALSFCGILVVVVWKCQSFQRFCSIASISFVICIDTHGMRTSKTSLEISVARRRSPEGRSLRYIFI
ncbi:hypothetical protein SODALDRAFT_359706 [Sodiomyces alkalinus F11]|uniref:Uncharacterized protein n=1 Tax=Sodiomyces alkalinus (strain CBS 110278 / VKM F-3762 / F11) TaxID=1314773 RepID=A0A3N2PVS5_SODAK|nr:hypothetical protein SODALDRAFT_359706 [Sodiomyces alkalinus F11]ROT38603.1 hypothetical protein SODALDRAFT_359706 [Sodiomyces alkalinus F11]